MKTKTIPLALALALAPAHAQQAAMPPDETAMHATRTPHSVFDAPGIVSRENADAPGNALSGDVADLLEFVPGVEIEGGPRRLGQNIRIRGYNPRSVLTLMDGRRQHFESAHDGRFFADPSLLKAVEIVRGGASSIYGSGAVGGVAALETKDAADFLTPGQRSGSHWSIGYRSASEEFFPSLIGYSRGRGWDAIGALSYRKSNSIETAGDSDPAEHSGEERLYSGMFKASRTVGGVHTLGVQVHAFDDSALEPGNGTSWENAANPPVDKRARDVQFGVKYEMDNPAMPYFSPRLHIYRKITEVEETDIPMTEEGERRRELKSSGFTADVRAELLNGLHLLSYGVEHYRDDQVGNFDGAPSAKSERYGIYLQDEISLGALSLIPSVRYDHHVANAGFQLADADDDGRREYDNVSPKIAASFEPIDGAMIFGSWSRAFRSPDLTEFYPAGRHFAGGFSVQCGEMETAAPENNYEANPDLKPEMVDAWEIGAGWDRRNLLGGGDRFGFKGAYYRHDASDLISARADACAGTTAYENIPQARITGFELESWYARGPFSARIGVSRADAEDKQSGEYLSNNVPLTFTAGLSWQVMRGATAGWRGRHAAKHDKTESGALPMESYNVHDIYVRWTPRENMIVDAGVDNVLDEHYTRRFASLPEEGRSYALKFSYQW